MNEMTKSELLTQHPLDPLTAEEISAAAAIAKSAPFFGDAVKFETIELHYPAKSLVQAWVPGRDLGRQAFICAYDTASNAVFEVMVDLAAGQITSLRQVPGARTAVVIDEIIACTEMVVQDPDFIAAMARRGITDMSHVQVDPFSAGNFGFEDEAEHRIVHCWVFYRSSTHDNGYAHPVEGLNVIYDLNKEKVLQVLDRTLVDVPMQNRNYAVRFDAVSSKLRDDLKEIAIAQPDGPSFTVEGHCVEWLNWRFHVEFNAREGLVLNDIRIRDGDEVRPVLFRASIAEMVVPYGDPNYGHYRKNAFDVGEYGLGRLANALKLGCDCRGHIHYFDGLVNNTLGDPVVIENAICLHEEDDGTLWKHTDLATGEVEVRRARKLVVSSVSTVGNYEYGFFWYFHLDGTIELDVKLTGIMYTAGLHDKGGDKYGTLVSPGVVAPNHQHIFCARLDMAVDGDANSLVEVNVRQEPEGPANPYGNGFYAEETVLGSEKAARRDRNPECERQWKVVNPSKLNRFGRPTAYKLVANSMVRTFHHPSTLMAKRAAFMHHHIWATPYKEEERYPAGAYVNQSKGDDGIAVWSEADRSIENTDIVLWHSFGILHLPRPEDFPVQPVVHSGFQLVANGFFDENPTLTIPPATDSGPA